MQISDYQPPEKIHNPRPVVIVCDATFYAKRRDKLGSLVFKDIDSETIFDYKQLLQTLLDLEYTIQSIIIDGKRGLDKAFKDYPIQMCHFHQRKTINKYLTRNPRLEASKYLQKI